jgi:hypothetical protein
MIKEFKLSHIVVSDMYTRRAEVWYPLGDDYLCEPSVENLMSELKADCANEEYLDCNPSFSDLVVDLR